MSSIPLPSLFVGMAGLDLLPQTRLKVACSLMAAERLILHPARWGEQSCALLVADEGTVLGRDAIAHASANRTPVIRLAERAQDESSGLVLGRKATVRDFVDALRAGLAPQAADAPANEASEPLPPFLDHLRLDRRRTSLRLMENGLVRLLVDSNSGQVHFLRRMPMSDLLQRALRTDWSVSEISEDTWRLDLSRDVTSTHSMESLWWRIAPGLPAHLVGVEFQGMQMRHWPDLDPGTVAAGWILPMACLQVREWRPQELANATQVPLKEILRIMAAARYAGLAGRPVVGANALVRKPSPASQARAVFQIAKRFGLRLLGVAND